MVDFAISELLSIRVLLLLPLFIILKDLVEAAVEIFGLVVVLKVVYWLNRITLLHKYLLVLLLFLKLCLVVSANDSFILII